MRHQFCAVLPSISGQTNHWGPICISPAGVIWPNSLIGKEPLKIHDSWPAKVPHPWSLWIPNHQRGDFHLWAQTHYAVDLNSYLYLIRNMFFMSCSSCHSYISQVSHLSLMSLVSLMFLMSLVSLVSHVMLHEQNKGHGDTRYMGLGLSYRTEGTWETSGTWGYGEGWWTQWTPGTWGTQRTQGHKGHDGDRVHKGHGVR